MTKTTRTTRRTVRSVATAVLLGLMTALAIVLVDAPAGATTTGSGYLPFPNGTRIYVAQANGSDPGCSSHCSQPDYYAWDFTAASGTTAGMTVVSATSGTVVGSRSSYQGTCSDFWSSCAFGNYVFVHNDDGTYVEYLHLLYGSVTVAKGARVRIGQSIAKVGATGYTGGAAHLHLSWLSVASGNGNYPSVGNSTPGSFVGIGHPTTHQTYTSNNPTLSSFSGVGTTAASANRGNTLSAGQLLYPHQYLVSSDVLTVLVMQGDGNLVEYALGGRVLWQTHTAGRPIRYAKMQSDGNFVLYFTDGSTPWSAGTSTAVWHPGGTHIVLQSDGNLVMYNSASPATATWASSWNGGTGLTTSITSAGRTQLTAGVFIYPKTFLRSPDRRYALLLQADGNCVLYGPGYHVLWSSRTGGTPMSHGVMQPDGNFVLYASDGYSPPWSTGTAQSGGVRLVVQSDGNVVIYRADGTWVWQTATSGKI